MKSVNEGLANEKIHDYENNCVGLLTEKFFSETIRE